MELQKQKTLDKKEAEIQWFFLYFFYNAQRSQYCNPNNDRMPNSRRFTQLPTSFKIQKRLPIELIPYNP